MRKRWWIGLPSLALAVLSACGGGDANDRDVDGREARPPSTTTTTPRPTEPPLAVDWNARTVTPSAVGAWTIRFCEGEAPLVCLDRDGENAGGLEVNTFPLASFDDPSLEAIAEDTVRTFQADRKDGCGADYLVDADDQRPHAVVGTDGLRYGWTATRKGEVVERNLTYAAAKGDTLVLLVAGALGPGGCLERQHEFSIEDLEAAEPVLDRLASANFDPRTTASGG